MPGLSGPHWRRVMAALANRDVRTAYAQIVLGEDVLPGVNEQRRTRAIAVLLEAGLAEWTGSRGLEAPDAVFRELLTQQPKRQPKTGVDRFLRLGRIDRYRQPGGPARAPGLDRRAGDPAGGGPQRAAGQRAAAELRRRRGAAAALPGRLRTAGKDGVGFFVPQASWRIQGLEIARVRQ